MEDLLKILKEQTDNNWLIGHNNDELLALTQALFSRFSQAEPTPTILLAEKNPVKFMAVFLAAVVAQCPIFLCNPDWREQEWEGVLRLVKPDLIFGHLETEERDISPLSPTSCLLPQTRISIPHSTQKSDTSAIMIPTGGSSGNIRFAMHTWETLTASVRGFQQYFEQENINSFCILPLYHVSGLMQFLRSFITKGKLVITSYQVLKIKGDRWLQGDLDLKKIAIPDFFISLVPTQLQFLLTCQPEWLSQFATVLLGGTPAWSSLLETARTYHICLAPTYGMTETASQIVTLKPDVFLKGNDSSGRTLPHARVKILNESGEVLGTKQTGIIAIEATSLCLGYYPQRFTEQPYFITDDLGYFDGGGYLHIVGRNSQKIITGGENVFPAEVEAAILATQLVLDVAVIGLPDAQWGEAVTAFYVPKQADLSLAMLQNAIADKISKFKHPKHWFALEKLPRNPQGKLMKDWFNCYNT
jgi:O-succinylbenzoic acid--CoA ligase